MFEPAKNARLFGLPPGVDFPNEFARGLLERLGDTRPEYVARVEIWVNNTRMQGQIRKALAQSGAGLLPRIRPITDLGQVHFLSTLPPPISGLRRRLELMALVRGLLGSQPDLAPRLAAFDLGDSLASLLDEMQVEGVAASAITGLDVSDQSGHWERTRIFVSHAAEYLSSRNEMTADARLRRVAEILAASWETAPPDHPILVVGSTGSRGATSMLMQAVARLPQGAVVLPGVDFDQPPTVWQQLDNATSGEDHPQYRFAALAAALDMSPTEVQWWRDSKPADSLRNRLVSLALRPAPVTDQWRIEGSKLGDPVLATKGLSLIEATSPRAEAVSVALAMRSAVEKGQSVALITPDRVLTRQVTTTLDRWGIRPDDSAGRPLPLTAPGRLLLQLADVFGRPVAAETLLAILKHPLVCTGPDARGQHLLMTRELELSVRKKGPPVPGPQTLLSWAGDDAGRGRWAEWLCDILNRLSLSGPRDLTDYLAEHITIAEALCAGPGNAGSGALWLEEPGHKARLAVDGLLREAEVCGDIEEAEYTSLIRGVLSSVEVRDAAETRPGVMIWGTLEARAQDADLVILSGLNEGVWPAAPQADPWLNRVMRHRAGLLLPECRTGLSAHDFQQAVCASQVILSRSVRDAEAQTVPSRWLMRLTNLLEGLGPRGKDSLDKMRDRGKAWVDLASALDEPDAELTKTPGLRPARRPAPCPPTNQRPRRLSITDIQRLIRNPYEIYARRILGLDPLQPLRRDPDARDRGSILHRVFEVFIREHELTQPDLDEIELIRAGAEVLEREAPWPTERRLWLAHLRKIANWFIKGEHERQIDQKPAELETFGMWPTGVADIVLRGKADRFDRLGDGSFAIYDYKTGAPPKTKEQEHFDKQLLLTAVMARAGAFDDLGPIEVSKAAYIGIGSQPVVQDARIDAGAIDAVELELRDLLSKWLDPARGYTSRRAVKDGFIGDYDHLARHGEWSDADEPGSAEVGR